MRQLTPMDLQHVVRSLPKDVRNALMDRHLYLAGGFIREVVAGEKASDIDLWGPTKEDLVNAAESLQQSREGNGELAHLHFTDNAVTLIAPPRLPIQFIFRWLFGGAHDIVKSLDFTVCQAAVWYDKRENRWSSLCTPEFYEDLAARRLVYTSPTRVEDCGGSMMRVRKFLGRGWTIQVDSLAKVIARLMSGVKNPGDLDEYMLGRVIQGKLREVDPLSLIDGLDSGDEHEEV